MESMFILQIQKFKITYLGEIWFFHFRKATAGKHLLFNLYPGHTPLSGSRIFCTLTKGSAPRHKLLFVDMITALDT